MLRFEFRLAADNFPLVTEARDRLLGLRCGSLPLVGHGCSVAQQLIPLRMASADCLHRICFCLRVSRGDLGVPAFTRAVAMRVVYLANRARRRGNHRYSV